MLRIRSLTGTNFPTREEKYTSSTGPVKKITAAIADHSLSDRIITGKQKTKDIGRNKPASIMTARRFSPPSPASELNYKTTQCSGLI